MNHRIALAIVALMTALGLAGCGGGGQDAREEAMVTAEPTRVVTVLPTLTVGPTETPEPPAGATTVPTTSVSAAPLQPFQPVVQFGRVELSRWEPQLLEQLTPNFSMQADGFIYFREESGASTDGWYQTAITPNLAAEFADRLINDVGILELAKAMPVTPTFGYKADGTPEDTAAVGVVYVKTQTKEGRLVIRQEDLVSPPPRNAARITKLVALLQAVQVWRQSAAREFQPGEADAMASVLGWWPLFNPQPYTPAQVTVFGTFAPDAVPATLGQDEVLEWPYLEGVDDTPPLSGTVKAAYGFAPTKVPIAAESPMVAALIRERRRLAPGAFWGPIWVDPAEPLTLDKEGRMSARKRFLVGIRAEVPGSNNVRFDYRFHPPSRLIETSGPASTSAGSR